MYFYTFISAFLLLLSILLSSLFHKNLLINELELFYSSYMSANRDLKRAYEMELYKTEKSKPKEAPISTPIKEEESPSYKKAISKEKKLIFGRMNIYPLLTQSRESQKELFDSCKNLLSILYGTTLLQELHGANPAEDLLLSLQESAKSVQTISHLEKLVLKNPLHQKIFYKMLKGTKKAYPSLLDYVFLEKNKTTIYPPYTYKEIFIAFYGKEVGEKLDKVKEKKEDFFQVLHEEEKKEDPLFSFIKKRPSDLVAIIGKKEEKELFTRMIPLASYEENEE